MDTVVKDVVTATAGAAPMFTGSICVKAKYQALFDYLVDQGWLWMVLDEYSAKLAKIVGSAAMESCYMKHLQFLFRERTRAEALLVPPTDYMAASKAAVEIDRSFEELGRVVRERFSAEAIPEEDTVDAAAEDSATAENIARC